MAITPGTALSCTNDDCPCRIVVEEPCPHGDAYTCACGHPLEPIADEQDRIAPTPGA